MSELNESNDPSAERASSAPCGDFDERLAAWLEGDLHPGEAAEMEWHRGQCARCGTIADELRALQQRVQSLPPLSPPRDLWAGIESRLVDRDLSADVATPSSMSIATSSASVADLTAHRVQKSRLADRQLHRDFRWMGIAALLLVAVTAGVTWRIARVVPAPSVTAGNTNTAPAPRSDSALGSRSVTGRAESAASVATASVDTAPRAISAGASESGAAVRSSPSANSVTAAARYASSSDAMHADRVYEREVRALRLIVERRFRELDTTTVRVLRDNLRIIDQAITDSRRALEKDPNSGLLSSQLDRSLEAKLELMRRVALL